MFNNSSSDNCVLLIRDSFSPYKCTKVNDIEVPSVIYSGHFVDFYYSEKFKCFVLALQYTLICISLTEEVSYIVLEPDAYSVINYDLNEELWNRAVSIGFCMTNLINYFMR